MGLPVRLSHRPTLYASSPGEFSIRGWSDRKKTVAFDLSRYGTDWVAQIRKDSSGTLLGQFSIDDSRVAQGELRLQLSGAQTTQLGRGYFQYDVEVSGGSRSPLTVFRGGFLVESDITRQVQT